MSVLCACGRRRLEGHARRCLLCVTEAGLRTWRYTPRLGYVSEQYEDERAWQARPAPTPPDERRRASWRASQRRRREAMHGC